MSVEIYDPTGVAEQLYSEMLCGRPICVPLHRLRSLRPVEEFACMEVIRGLDEWRTRFAGPGISIERFYYADTMRDILLVTPVKHWRHIVFDLFPPKEQGQ